MGTITTRHGALRRRLSRWTRIMLGLLGASLLVPLGGMWYEHRAAAQDRARFPPPGQLVDVGGRMLHLQIMGAQHSDGPTVVLEAGSASFSVQWAWVQPAVARFARVVSYDRAGLGWSDPATTPRDGTTIARELYTALQAVHINGPYVLVGHSYGGLLVRNFTAAYPDEVVGIVLVDPSHPQQRTAFREAFGGGESDSGAIYRIAEPLARLGLVRLLNPFGALTSGLPAQQAAEAQAFFATPQHLHAAGAELAAWQHTAAQVQAAPDLGDLPLRVISAAARGGDPRLDTIMGELHTDLADLSTNGGRRILPGSRHESLATVEEHALETVTEIRAVVELAQHYYSYPSRAICKSGACSAQQ